MICIWLLCGFLLSACTGPKEPDIRYYELQKKLADLDGYNQQINTILKRKNLSDVQLFYRQLRFVIPLNEKEIINIYIIKGVENLFSVYCYLNVDSSEQVASHVDLELLSDIINAVSIDKVKVRELREFVDDPNDEYKVSSKEKLKKTAGTGLSYYLVIDDSYGSRLDITGNIRTDVDFFSFFALLENIYVKWNYELQPCEYGVNYQVNISDKSHMEYGFYTYVYRDDTFIGNERFTLDYSNQLSSEEEAFINIDIALFKDIIDLFAGVEITETILKDFLYDKTGKYNDGDEFYLISRTYNFYYESDWDLSYFLSTQNSETLTYYGEFKPR